MSSATLPRASSAVAKKSCRSKTTSRSASAIRWPTPPPPSACSRPSASPQMVDTRNDTAPVAHVRQQGHQDLSRLRRVLRHGRRDRAGRVATSATPRRAWKRRSRSSICSGPVGGGKSSIAERLKQLMEHVPFYAIKGSPVNESPLGLFDAAEDGPLLEKEYGIPRALPEPHPVARGPSSASTSTAATSASSSVVKRYPSRPQADRHRQDRAGRREQPGHLGAGRQGRHPQARDLSPRTTRTPTATPAACAWPTRACSSSSRCSRRRSRCCTRC